MKVYRVFTTGGDNDETIWGIFSTQEKADAFARAFAAHHHEPPGSVEVDSWLLDEPWICRCWRLREAHEILS